ncbi:hypothetical protein FB45DRAFT_1132235 [Roridomyces roridus]|uniref:Uncharacterized protein n=1 Tax=Roridomyces roridus TaxID=1738132 RepID=A0AAD7FQY6_9AGAR|nr:hypothetical protein FB45DRAFT_1132235 [Roridomyces roridus]
MDALVSYQAILFPSDGRKPYLVDLMTSPTQYGANPGPRMPHPEGHMDFIVESRSLPGGMKPWRYLIVDALDQMTKNFNHPYIVYYPVMSRDGMPFPINQAIRDIQGKNFNEHTAWRGNIIIGKFREHDQPFTSMMDASISDFPILKNFMGTRPSPRIQ